MLLGDAANRGGQFPCDTGTGTVWPCGEDLGRGPDPAWAEEATDASRCSPAVLPASGVNVGKVGRR